MPWPGRLWATVTPSFAASNRATMVRPRPAPAGRPGAESRVRRCGRSVSGVHPAPVVGHRQLDVVALVSSRGTAGRGSSTSATVMLMVMRPAAPEHGVVGVAAEAHEHLLHLGRAGQHGTARAASSSDLDVHRLGQDVSQQLDRGADDRLQPHGTPVVVVLAMVAVDLAAQLGGRLPGLDHLGPMLPGRRRGVEVVAREARLARGPPTAGC